MLLPGISDCIAKSQPTCQASSLSWNELTRQAGWKKFMQLEMLKQMEFAYETSQLTYGANHVTG